MSELKKQEIDLSLYENVMMNNFGSTAKVFVTDYNDGSHEWSFSAPAYLTDPENQLFNNAVSFQNCITLFETMPEIFAPLNEIATRVSDLNFVLKRFDNDEIVWDNENFNRLMMRPNPLMNFRNHIWQSVVFEYLFGASIQYLNKPKISTADFNSIKTIINVPTNRATIEVDMLADPYTSTEIKDFIKRVYVKRPNGDDRDLELANLILSTNPDLQNGNQVNKFKSKLSGAAAAIANLIPVYMARNQIYVKRGALGFIVSKKRDASGSVALTPKEKESMEREFLKGYGVTGQNSMFPVASNEVDFIKTSASIQEMQPFDETSTDARAIYAVLRVPKSLCPTKDNPTFNNADAELKNFYRDVVLPIGKMKAVEYTDSFKIPNHYVDIDTSGIDILQENKKERAETNRTDGEVYERRFFNGVCTLNDWVVAAGGERSTNSLYDKRILDMTDEERALIKNSVSLRSTNLNQNNNGTSTTNPSA